MMSFFAAALKAELTASPLLVVCTCTKSLEQVQCRVDLCYLALDFVALSI